MENPWATRPSDPFLTESNWLSGNSASKRSVAVAPQKIAKVRGDLHGSALFSAITWAIRDSLLHHQHHIAGLEVPDVTEELPVR